MGFVPYDEKLAAINPATTAVPRTEQSLWAASFRQENPVVNAIAKMAEPAFGDDPSFDIRKRYEKEPALLQFSENFAGTSSDAEFDFLRGKLLQEQRDRETLAAGGLGSIATTIVAGLATPTILIPGGGFVRGVSVGRTAFKIGSLAAVGTAIDEAALQAQQELRTKEETITALGASFVIGAVIGGGVAKYIDGREAKGIEAGMAGTEDGVTIQPDLHPSINDGSLSAAEVDKGFFDPGKMVGLGPLTALHNRINPVSRTLAQGYSSTARWLQASISTGGLIMERHAAGQVTAIGGEVEQLVKQHRFKYLQGKQANVAGFKEYKKNFSDPTYREKYGQQKRLNEREFQEEIGRALDNPDAETIPEARAAANVWREQVLLPFLDAADESGLLTKEITDIDGNVTTAGISKDEAAKYFHRMTKRNLAVSQYTDLEDILFEHIRDQRLEKAQNYIDRERKQIAKKEEAVAFMNLDEAGVAAKREELEGEFNVLPTTLTTPVPEAFSAIRSAYNDLLSDEIDIADLPTMNNIVSDGDILGLIRALKTKAAAADKVQAKAIRRTIASLRENTKDQLKSARSGESAIRKKMQVLNKTSLAFNEQQTKLLNQVESLESAQIRTMERAFAELNKLKNGIAKITDEDLPKAISSARKELEATYKIYEKGEAKLDKLRAVGDDFLHLVDDDLRPTEKISIQEALQQRRQARTEAAMDQLDELETFPREGIAGLLQSAMDDVLENTRRINDRRAVRADKLQKEAAQLSPENRAKLVKDQTEELRARKEKVRDRLLNELSTTSKGDIFKGEAELDVTKYARDAAAEIAHKLAGNSHRHTMSLLGEARGPELMRTLNIDPNKVWSNGKTYGEFLEWDVEKVMRSYTRQMAPDIELMKKYGTTQPLGNNSIIRERMVREFTDARRAAAAKGLLPKALEKELKKINTAQEEAFRDLQAQVDRLRHSRGISDNPNGYAYRTGRAAKNLNVLRMMGGVVNSSIPDIGRPIMKMGLLNTFKHGFVPLVTNLKGLRMSGAEAKYAGANVDLGIGARNAGLFDIMDETMTGSAPEKALQWGANNFGVISGMDYWNAGVKSFTTSIANARFIKSMADVAAGKASRSDMAFLAQNGIDSNAATVIWKEITQTPGGGDNINGVYLPNTQSWKNLDAVRLYRAALAKVVDDTIITPGMEKPLWTDANMFGSLVAQFRSFTFSSSQKVMIAAGQDMRLGNYAPIISGMMMSLSMGAISYAIWANIKGGKYKTEMQNAPVEKWALEAILRSGLLGVFGELQRTAERIPATQQIATLGTGPSSRSAFAQPVLEAFGPTAGLIQDLGKLIVSADEPTAGTVSTGRRLVPLQNLTPLVWAFNRMEELSADLMGVN